MSLVKDTWIKKVKRYKPDQSHDLIKLINTVKLSENGGSDSSVRASDSKGCLKTCRSRKAALSAFYFEKKGPR